MTMKHDEKARLETLLYSTGGVIALLAVLILANFVFGTFKQRIDLTDGRLFTLTEGTRAVLGKLDSPVRIRFYFSQGDNNVPLQIKAFGRRVEDLLAEYRQQSGGKLIAMVDPFSYFDAQYAPQAANGAAGTASALSKLFTAWGIGYDGSRVLADTRYQSGDGARAMPTVLTLLGESFNTNDIATKRLSNLLMPFAGGFTGKPAEGLTQTVLVKSSKLSQFVDSADATKAGEAALSGFKPSGTEYPVVLKLTGKFKTAYPDGKPVEVPKDDGKGGPPAKPVVKPVVKADPNAKPEPAPLKESGDTAVILIADADFVNDGAAVQIQDVFGQRVVVPSNGNLALVQALVEQFAGDPNLITVRSRATVLRPFTVIRDMEAQAQQAYTGKIKELETQLKQSTDKLQALQQSRAPGQQNSTILTPEQQAEIDKFRQTSAEARRELKEVRKDLRAESESLQFWTKVVNIGVVPLLVALAGLALAIYRRKRVVTL